MKVLISGSGTVGPLLAIALKRAGFQPVLFDKAPAFRDVGGGINLAPNGLLFIKRLGLLEDLVALGAPMKSTTIKKWDGSLITRFTGDQIRQKFEVTNLGIKRHSMHQYFMQAVEKEKIPVFLNKEVVAILRNAEDGVVIQFADGTKESGDILIGADGLSSGTRQALFGKEEPRFTGVVAVIGIVKHTDSSPFQPADGQIFQGGGRQIGIYGIRPNESLWFCGEKGRKETAKENWVVEDSQAQSMAREIADEFQRRKLPQEVCDFVKQSYRVIRYGIFDRNPIQTWSKGNITLVGDAAHPMPPHLGQGGNTALEDVGVLAELLKEFPTNPRKAFQVYEDMRLKRTYRTVAMANWMGKMNYIESDFLCSLRDRFLQFAFRNGPPVDDMFGYDYLKEVHKQLGKQ
jgi:salicylate hydroxylase